METGWRWLDDRMQDADDVGTAFAQGLYAYAPAAAIRDLGEGFESILSSLIPALGISLGIVGASAAIGAVGGGALGSLAGGIGAAPGIVGGASAGMSAGLALLNLLGIGFLVVYVKDRLGEVGVWLDKGFNAAISANGDPGRTDQAARHFGEAMGLFASLLVEALVMYFAGKGVRAGSETIAKTRLGARVALAAENNPAFLARVRIMYYAQRIGVPTASAAMRKKIAVAAAFFESAAGKGFKQEEIASYLKGIDFSKAVEVVQIPPGTNLMQRTTNKVGNWFTRRGSSGRTSGISMGESTPGAASAQAAAIGQGNKAAATRLADNLVNARETLSFRTDKPTTALKSTAAAMGDSFTSQRTPTFNHGMGTVRAKVQAIEARLAQELPAKIAKEHPTWNNDQIAEAVRKQIRGRTDDLGAFATRELVAGGGEQYFIPNGGSAVSGAVPMRPGK